MITVDMNNFIFSEDFGFWSLNNCCILQIFVLKKKYPITSTISIETLFPCCK